MTHDVDPGKILSLAFELVLICLYSNLLGSKYVNLANLKLYLVHTEGTGVLHLIISW